MWDIDSLYFMTFLRRDKLINLEVFLYISDTSSFSVKLTSVSMNVKFTVTHKVPWMCLINNKSFCQDPNLIHGCCTARL
jgi:hypothetical protein